MTTTDTTTHDWLDRMNESYAEVCSDIENGGDWVAYEFPADRIGESLRVVVDGEMDEVRIIYMIGYAVDWQIRLDLNVPHATSTAIIHNACGIMVA